MVGDYSILAPGAVVSGSVQIEQSCYIGAPSAIRQNLKIGRGVLVGMGAVVTRDIPPKTVVVGVPAKPVRRSQQ